MLTAIYELPWGPGKRWMNESLLGKIVGGWQLSGLFIAQSGSPLNITGNGTLLNTPGNTAFANLNGSNKVLGGLGPGQLYFDPSVYALPAAGVQGNMRRNGGPEGPGFWQLDTSLFKRFSVGGIALRRVPRRRVQHDQLGPLGQPGHRLQHCRRQHLRPDHRHQRRPAQPEVWREVRVLDGFRVQGSGSTDPDPELFRSVDGAAKRAMHGDARGIRRGLAEEPRDLGVVVAKLDSRDEQRPIRRTQLVEHGLLTGHELLLLDRIGPVTVGGPPVLPRPRAMKIVPACGLHP